MNARYPDPAQIAAQVAVEAVANDPDAYDFPTVVAVLENGEANGVPEFYLDLVRQYRRTYEAAARAERAADPMVQSLSPFD